jgi:hypothetical protein
MSEKYYHDYPTEPIGGGNPYYRCVHCKRSDPEINGRLEKHDQFCQYRQEMEAKLTQWLKVRSWHGSLENGRGTHPLAIEMNSIAQILTDGYEWEFNGTPGEFVTKWPHKFMVWPNEKNPKEPSTDDKYSHHIFITQHSHFGQR